jgi:hypothetical protein
MKVFFGATALALVISTRTRPFMSWKYGRRKAVVEGMFLAGIVCSAFAPFMRRDD